MANFSVILDTLPPYGEVLETLFDLSYTPASFLLSGFFAWKEIRPGATGATPCWASEKGCQALEEVLGYHSSGCELLRWR